jgi:hypothetical protein
LNQVLSVEELIFTVWELIISMQSLPHCSSLECQYFHTHAYFHTAIHILSCLCIHAILKLCYRTTSRLFLCKQNFGIPVTHKQKHVVGRRTIRISATRSSTCDLLWWNSLWETKDDILESLTDFFIIKCTTYSSIKKLFSTSSANNMRTYKCRRQIVKDHSKNESYDLRQWSLTSISLVYSCRFCRWFSIFYVIYSAVHL